MMSFERAPHDPDSEALAIAEISAQGFQVATRDYEAGQTEPHAHDYDVCLHILSGQFRLGIVDEATMHSFGTGERCLVPAGTVHFEAHGPLRMVVGRREPANAGVLKTAEEA